jgi:murein L,D-transpeptidase YcbB/YkuD
VLRGLPLTLGVLASVALLSLAGCTDRTARQPRIASANIAGAVADAIRARASRDRGAGAPTIKEREELAALYGPDGYAPYWVDARGEPTATARDAVSLLEHASDQGLNPEDYDARQLDALGSILEAAEPAASRDVAAFEVDLSRDVLRYFHDIHLGRVDPRTMGLDTLPPHAAPDFVALLRSALESHHLAEAAAALAPPLGLYNSLVGALARYRALAARTDLAVLPKGPVAHPGDPYSSTGVLYRRLFALGDWPATASTPSAGETVYEGAMVDAVRHFQARHGLETDGVIGASTLAALNTPLSWRVRQIELSLERLRWLPAFTNSRLILVNIPMFRLSAWNTAPPDAPPALSMGVIVGQAFKTETPEFAAEMRYLVFRPYWNVPISIVRSEMLPALAKDPGYFSKEDLEIVRDQNDQAESVPITPDNLVRLSRGLLRLRQRPGPKNSLGLVKFMFPNEESVYLHDTPATELFTRTRRDFSHGCVRVENPVSLAEWVLNDPEEWSREKILEAENGSDARRVDLEHPVQVVLFYLTASVEPEDGTVRFANDIYERDARLDASLRGLQTSANP